ncbi:aconitase X swivel domain-containing protein [Halarsenatibacter silvermanii]|uniref:Predicted aconitase subunit 2 n=1 Tax=Halarsenatibacter silvermanii TaxID=321763 RepID=A0A1G9RGH3_9FIRM|nr:DUF126 domain-containing protein [Halarsenatibacter silvermanii]SDM22422.1 predicted aconitase subunit 2 [Halarsenatibacter silvermanii]
MNKFKCREISAGQAEGEVLFSSSPLCFYLVEPAEGIVIEEGHDLEGKDISGKILAFPGGKGSSVVQADGLYQLMIEDNAPAGLIIKNPDTVLVATSIIMEIPLVDQVEEGFYAEIEDKTQIKLDTEKEYITPVPL